MTGSSIRTCNIKIPALKLFEKRVGRNLLLHIAEVDQVNQVEVFRESTKKYILKDKSKREYLLCLPRAHFKNDTHEFCLKTKGELNDINQLSKSTVLVWMKHPCLGKNYSSDQIRQTWEDGFSFVEEDVNSGKAGLRQPQLGALHAISARWTVEDKPSMVVMPTGTGKTETMLATLIYRKCGRILVIVPSDILRKQLFEKFVRLGKLFEIGAINQSVLKPKVLLLQQGINSVETAREVVLEANVIITTPSLFNKLPPDVQSEFTKLCSHLFIDEAHHLAAQTWKQIVDLFPGKPTLQFTATPFRNDKKQIGGEIIYNYPLSLAQQNNYFKKIGLIPVEEFDEDLSDLKVAEKAIFILNEDIKNGYDHLLMARVSNKKKADEVLKIYQEKGSEHNPVILYSGLKGKKKADALKSLHDRASRIIVCVDMLGEGFDLPNFKIAAIHDIHKSLAITLQFTGRFTRIGSGLGNASAVVNIADIEVQKGLENLYAEDSDWNILLQRHSESTIAKTIELQNVIGSFSGELTKNIPLWNLRPSNSMVVYKTTCTSWTPEQFRGVIPKKCDCWPAISNSEKILVFVLGKQDDVSWGKYRDIKNLLFDLFIVHWNQELQLLFLHSSNYDAINTNALCRAVCGESVQLLSGPSVFRVYSNVERPMVSNLGASKSGTIRYTMYFGPDVAVGLSQVEKSESELNNIFGWGYEDGEKISYGCSSRKGKLWGRGGGTIADWRNWCLHIASKLTNDQLEENEIIKQFLRPEEIKERPKLVPLSIEWGEGIIRNAEERIAVSFGSSDQKIYDVELSIHDYSADGPIKIKLSAGNTFAIYALEIDPHGYRYTLSEGSEISVKIGGGAKVALIDYLVKDPFVVTYSDGSFSYNNYYVKATCEGVYDSNLLILEDWSGVNIKVESEEKERKSDSIQYKMIEKIREDFDIIINDDGAREAADIVALRKESDNLIKLRLIHCKFSSEDTPGARIEDFYELCGQAQKSIRWKHNGIDFFMDHLRRREAKWQEEGKTRFIKGGWKELIRLKRQSRHSKISFEIHIVQPGLKKSQVTDDILKLLGATELYLKKTAEADFQIICNE
ncbi:MAG: DEAD/DEAH box helicase family protein [Candidatus Omnitrophota bacterium]|nr:DEAD/DEAH box helicase family protein [Candidatus Omnitrophota bacterium]